MVGSLFPQDRYPQGHPYQASILNELGSLLQAQGSYSGAHIYCERAVAICEALYPKDRCPRGHPDLATSLNNLGAVLAAQGSYDGSGSNISELWRFASSFIQSTVFPMDIPILKLV